MRPCAGRADLVVGVVRYIESASALGGSEELCPQIRCGRRLRRRFRAIVTTYCAIRAAIAVRDRSHKFYWAKPFRRTKTAASSAGRSSACKVSRSANVSAASCEAKSRTGAAGSVPKHDQGSHGPAAAEFQVWDTSRPADFAAWIALWNSWPGREVFAHPAYLTLFQTDADRVQCACFESPTGTVLYPFLLREHRGQPFWDVADGPATDVTTPIGYGGPVAWNVTDRDGLTAGFWNAFNAWAKSVGVVSEFARLSLFYETLIDDPRDRHFRQQNVVRSLEPAEPEMWMDFRHKVRKNVNHARRSGVHVELDLHGERLDDFLRIYQATMERRGADTSVRFDRDFFTRLQEQLGGQFAYFHAISNDRIVSTELVLISATNVYSWLGGTEEYCFDLRPNDLLKYEIMIWAKDAGKRCFVLGGGFEPDDGIFKYKLTFAPGGAVDFYLRKRIVLPERYRTYCERSEAWRAQHGRAPASGDFFPAYRA
jgi:hypothetical protein